MASLQKRQEIEIEKSMNKWWDKSNSVNILISGRTGTGKSSLVNAILGKEAATVGSKLDPETSEVASFDDIINGIKVIIWDSPGLQDGLNNEASYLSDIKAKCKDNIDLFIYCVSMTNKRFMSGSRDIDSMCKLTDALGPKIWENAIFVLTCANKFITFIESSMPDSEDKKVKVEEKFTAKLKMWKTVVKEIMNGKLGLSAETIEKLPILPAGIKGIPILLESYSKSPWLSELWMESLLATRRDAQPALIKMNHNRLVYASDIKSEEEFKELLEKECIVIKNKASDEGKHLNADEAAQIVGEKSGLRACIAHIVERIFGNDPTYKHLYTAVDINEENIAIYIHLYS